MSKRPPLGKLARPDYRATDSVAVAFEIGSQRTGSPRPQQLEKPPPPKLPAVPLGGSRSSCW